METYIVEHGLDTREIKAKDPDDAVEKYLADNEIHPTPARPSLIRVRDTEGVLWAQRVFEWVPNNV